MLRALVSLALCIASVKAAAMLRSGYATDAEIVAGLLVCLHEIRSEYLYLPVYVSGSGLVRCAGNVTTTSSSDYYVFALQQCESHSAFTIHGLW
jgi:hypothetical protein